MLEKVIENNSASFVFRPTENEKKELFTNDYVLKMPRDEFSRYELIGGEIIVSTAPRFIHQLLATRIVAQFSKYLEKNPIGEILTTPGLIFSEYDGVIPDLVFITHERIEEILNKQDEKFHGAPEIVIEILSPGRVNARRDLQVKRELYDMYQVPEYWVVDPFDKEILVFKRNEPSLRQGKFYRKDEAVETPFLPKFKLKINNLFTD
jgi:Uma2 family endonuclease